MPLGSYKMMITISMTVISATHIAVSVRSESTFRKVYFAIFAKKQT